MARYLRDEFSTVLTGATLNLPGVPTELSLPPDAPYFLAPHWAGLWGVFPGTASGNEPAEALHSRWQRLLRAAGKILNVASIFPAMQRIYVEEWQKTFDWDSKDALSPVPRMLEQGLLNGRTLPRVNRSPAVHFHTAAAAARGCYRVRATDARAWIAMSRHAEQELDVATAELGLDMMEADTLNICEHLLKSGIVTWRAKPDEEIGTRLASFDWPHADSAGRTLLYHNTAFNRVSTSQL